DEVPEFEPAMRRYLEAGMRLSTELFELMACAAGVPADTFTRLCSDPLNNLNLTWYPPLVVGDETVEPEPDQFRIGPHSYFGTITVLHREPSDPPLQVQLPDGGWEDLPHVPDAFIVNTGDQLAYWSGGRWRSNPHRIPAPTGDAARVGRLSLVLFVETDVGAMLEPIGRPGDEPMDATEYLIDKLVAIDTAV
ncbi:MAG: 2OG-Fe(II) oxygenase family protein, partial [Actinomycetota bacterium]